MGTREKMELKKMNVLSGQQPWPLPPMLACLARSWLDAWSRRRRRLEDYHCFHYSHGCHRQEGRDTGLLSRVGPLWPAVAMDGGEEAGERKAESMGKGGGS